jgi:hypothetical protein
LVAHAARDTIQLGPTHAFHANALIACVSREGVELWGPATGFRFDEDALKLASLGSNGLANRL